jgi:hypothetical protein
MPFPRLHSVLVSVIAALAPATYALAVCDQDAQQRALDIIEKSAERLCGTVSQNSTTRSQELSGEAKAELNSVLSKLANVGGEVAAKSQESTTTGVLQKDLVEALKDASDCRVKVLQSLQDKLLPSCNTPANPTAEPRPTPVTPGATRNRIGNFHAVELSPGELQVSIDYSYDGSYGDGNFRAGGKHALYLQVCAETDEWRGFCRAEPMKPDGQSATIMIADDSVPTMTSSRVKICMEKIPFQPNGSFAPQLSEPFYCEAFQFRKAWTQLKPDPARDELRRRLGAGH